MNFYTALDHGFPENPKVMKLHDRAFRLHIIALDYCSRNLTDGHVSARAVKVISAILDSTSKRWIAELVAAGLWKHDEAGDGFWINDYTKHNPSAASLKKLRDSARERGLKGAEARWGKRTETDRTDDGSSHSRSHGNSHSNEQMAEQRSEVGLLSQNSGRQFEDGLPLSNQLLVARLMREIGDHADQGTQQVIRAKATGLPDSSLVKVIESLENNPRIRDRAAYAVAALNSETDERRRTA